MTQKIVLKFVIMQESKISLEVESYLEEIASAGVGGKYGES